MRKRWIRRRLLVIIFTFFIIVLVDFQLRASSFSRINVDQALAPPDAPRSFIQQVPRGDARSSWSSSSSRGQPQHPDRSGGVSEGPSVPLVQLKLQDIYIAVKTTGRFHKTRLALLLETWISRTKTHVSVAESDFKLCFSTISLSLQR